MCNRVVIDNTNNIKNIKICELVQNLKSHVVKNIYEKDDLTEV